MLRELEIAPKVLSDDGPKLGTGLDEPRMFGAYLNALRWTCVSSTDQTLLALPRADRADVDRRPPLVDRARGTARSSYGLEPPDLTPAAYKKMLEKQRVDIAA